MHAHRRILRQVAVAAGLRATAEIEPVIYPQSPDRRRVRPSVGTDRADPIVLRLGHPIGHMGPGKQSLFVFRHAVARHMRPARLRPSFLVGPVLLRIWFSISHVLSPISVSRDT